MPEANPATAQILIVDAKPAELRLAALALRECDVSSSLHVARTTAEAIRRLRGVEDCRRGRPSLVLLGTAATKEDRADFLAGLRAAETSSSKKTPVIALMPERAADPESLRTCRELANCCIPQPNDFDEWLALMQAAETLWLRRQFPPEPSPRRRAMGNRREERRKETRRRKGGGGSTAAWAVCLLRAPAS